MQRVVFIMGPTACGKGAVSRALAKRLAGPGRDGGAQILSVDSMKVYRRMDIGTAKPSAEAQAQVPHHGIDLVEPGAHFSVAEYVEHADAAIKRIAAAGDVPLAVGGTNLYIKALSEGLFPGPSAEPELRAALRRRARIEGSDVLHAELAQVDAAAAERIHPNDEKRILRALEVYRTTGRPISELQRQWGRVRRYDCVFIGLRRERADLHGRINRRAEHMVDSGLRDEVAALLDEPAGLAPQAAQAVGYAEMIDHLRGWFSLDAACERIKIHTRRLAKRQRTWQRRWRDMTWLNIRQDETPDAVAQRIVKRMAL
ncbi:MAG: tRNA (adenosine(37)-N6)-dimethylallyltransferase MiaA [Phycisphaerae bacterium]|nr:tRNA (adenosine(37)-N6)-dimethylallyltransferase MiaA [Phycisphaerae bacterium]